MRDIFLFSLAAVSLAACSTTQRAEVRADLKNVEKQKAELDAAKRDGTINEVKEEQHDLQQARRELREDQKELYRPVADGSPNELRIGQRESGKLRDVPAEYASQYRDRDGSYYRYDGQRIYQFSSIDRTVTHIYPVGR
jgi:hypothetical protein